jgi:hypothetical protein
MMFLLIFANEEWINEDRFDVNDHIRKGLKNDNTLGNKSIQSTNLVSFNYFYLENYKKLIQIYLKNPAVNYVHKGLCEMSLFGVHGHHQLVRDIVVTLRLSSVNACI